MTQDDYVLFDCPGQIELYSHLDVMPKLLNRLVSNGFSLCTVCLLDSTFLYDDLKFVSGLLASLSFHISLQLPSLSILSKCDLVDDKKFL